MKTNIQYNNKTKERQHCPMSNLKRLLFVAFFAIMALQAHASQNNVIKSDTAEIDIYKSGEEAEIVLKAWMLDVELFRQFVMDRETGFSPCMHLTKTHEEKELPLETWMLIPELFHKRFENVKAIKEPVAEWDAIK